MASSANRRFTSQTGPLIRGWFGIGQERRHSKPHLGHLKDFAPDGAVFLSKQFKHLKEPVVLPLAVASAVVSVLLSPVMLSLPLNDFLLDLFALIVSEDNNYRQTFGTDLTGISGSIIITIGETIYRFVVSNPQF